MDSKDVLNILYKECGLTQSDIHEQKGRNGNVMFRIITRSGIEKIQAVYNIDVKYEVITHNIVKVAAANGDTMREKTEEYVVIKATCTYTTKEGQEIQIETFGECNPGNTTQNYIFSIAEKRALARGVLKAAGFYKHGFFSEDESDDFRITGRKQ